MISVLSTYISVKIPSLLKQWYTFIGMRKRFVYDRFDFCADFSNIADCRIYLFQCKKASYHKCERAIVGITCGTNTAHFALENIRARK